MNFFIKRRLRNIIETSGAHGVPYNVLSFSFYKVLPKDISHNRKK